MTKDERTTLVAQVAAAIYSAVELPPSTRDRAGLAVDTAMVIVDKAEKKIEEKYPPGGFGTSQFSR
jgi:hypothetical protein